MALWGAGVVPVLAQSGSPPTPEERTLLERTALAKARSELLRQVYALPIDDSLSVGAWAARDLGRDRALRLWLRSLARLGDARFYSDGTCDADVRLEPEVLRDKLVARLSDQATPTSEPAGAREIRRAAAKWPVLWGSGTATRSAARSRKPNGWEDVSFEGIEVARRAAEADARSALLDKAGELPVTNARRLREFLESSDAVHDAVLEALARSAAIKVSFELDQVAVAEARVGLIDLIRILTDVHQTHYRGELFHAADFREMAVLTRLEELNASGLAVPPSDLVLKARYRPIELDAPPWVDTTLRAVGRFEPADDDTLTPGARAEAARLDGADRMREKVEALIIQKDITVATFLAHHDELKDDVIVFLGGARAVAPARTLEGGAVEVSVELPLRRLWWILRRGMKAVEVDVPDEPTTQPIEKTNP